MLVSTVIERTRMLLQDEDSAVWSNLELSQFINEGQQEYARRAACLQNKFKIKTENGTGQYPSDFLDFKYAVNSSGLEILPATWQRLMETQGEEFESVEGVPEYIYDNFSDDGDFKVYPVPDQNIVDFTADSAWGLVEDITGLDDMSLSDIWGRIDPDDLEVDGIWGITDSLCQFDEVGNVYYTRKPVDGAIEIPDYIALVYFAAAKAYELETERKNQKIAEALYSIFEGRVYLFSRAEADSTISKRSNKTGVFF